MKLSPARIRALCRKRGTTLTALLREAGVSRTAYYALARKDSLVPGTVTRIAGALGVRERDLTEDGPAPAERLAASLLEETREVLARHPEASFENVWHTLVLLREPPIDRLRRSLVRGRAAAHR